MYSFACWDLALKQIWFHKSRLTSDLFPGGLIKKPVPWLWKCTAICRRPVNRLREDLTCCTMTLVFLFRILSPPKIKVAKQKNFLYCPFCLILVNSLFLPFYLSLVYINFEQLSAVFEIIHICVCACVYSNKRQRTARKLCLWMKSENELCVTESDAAAERE